VSNELNARITRYLLVQKIKENWISVLAAPLIVAVVLLAIADYPTSHQERQCRYIRWTMDQPWKLGIARYGKIVPLVFCDLENGATIGALAIDDWVPPRPGDMMTIDEQTMYWGGRRYRVR
jgi:hypothetical protein